MRVKIALWRFKNVLFGEVLEMDESLRGAGTIAEDGQTGYIIASSDQRDSPMLEGGRLILRGVNETCDTDAFCLAYCTERDAIYTADIISRLIDQINDSPESSIERVL